jgi:hypothetical protein
MPRLSRLNKVVDLRQAWEHEALNFTPWLAEPDNLQTLADTLDLGDLELIQTEYPIGEFKLDILCKDEDGKVIIENQLEKTDHTHLGQIISYASGIGAKKVIWIAKKFRPEHVTSLEFLNQNTTEDLNFFGIEIELYQIDDSAMAPKFNVVVQPNGWEKLERQNVKIATKTSETAIWQFKFWMQFKQFLDLNNYDFQTARPDAKNYLNIRIGKSGYKICSSIISRDDKLSVEIYIDHKDSKSKYSLLEERKREIESALGYELDWRYLDRKHACRILKFKTECDVENEAEWENHFKWLAQTVKEFYDVFVPIIKSI